MPIYSVSHGTTLAKSSYEQGPVLALETDLASLEAIPAAVRSAADTVVLQNLGSFRSGKVPRSADGVITWLTGDRLLEGSAANIRRDLRISGRRCFVTVHLPCLSELDLLCVQPRWIGAGAIADYRAVGTRILSTPSATPLFREAVSATTRPWAQLVQALLAEQVKPQAGIEALGRMANDGAVPTFLSALALRNLIVLLIRHNEIAKAEQLVDDGLKAYVGYAELAYVGALLSFAQQKYSKVPGFLDRTRFDDRGYIGSGGEKTYRASWLMGKVAALVGRQQVAFEYFLQGMFNEPTFTPAVDELLKMRFSPALVEKHQHELRHLVRQEPRYASAVFDFLLLHRAFAAARLIVDSVPLAEEEKAALRGKLESAVTPFKRDRTFRGSKPGVILSGPFFEHSSFARINREIGAALLQSTAIDASLEPFSHPTLLPQQLPHGSVVHSGLFRQIGQLDLTIRHHWPPDFRKPASGSLAVIVPWEYGTVPRVWVEQIEQNVDELWLPSSFVRDVFVRSGVSAARTQVIPNGIDPALFTPDGSVSRPRACRKFMFLFVGGAIRRKGIDLLLQAYRNAFTSGDDVTLVVSTGANPAYAHNTLDAALLQFAQDARAPHLEILADSIDDVTLANVYRGCDAFVLPYRGEGFGMPILEAMACGKPVITTAQGPSQDFCTSEAAYLISARETEVPDEPPLFGELAGEFTWFEPDAGELARTMLHVYSHVAEAGQRGRAAAKLVRQKYTWSRITQRYQERIQQLTRNGAEVHDAILQSSGQAI